SSLILELSTTATYTLSLHDALPIYGHFPEHDALDDIIGLRRHDPGEAERSDGLHERQAQDLGRYGARDEDAEPLQASRRGDGGLEGLRRSANVNRAGWSRGVIHPA